MMNIKNLIFNLIEEEEESIEFSIFYITIYSKNMVFID